MSGTFSSRTYNFNTLLGRSSFPDYTTKHVVIPPFQRGFSWEKSHIATFWEDIWEFHGQSRKDDTYFLGPIVILPKSDQMTILDGQQRLATATILFANIRDLARKKGGQKGADLARDIQRDLILIDEDNETYALEPSQLDREFFENHVQSDPPTEDEKARVRSHRLIRQAKLFFKNALEQHFAAKPASDLVSGLKALRTTLAERIKLVVIDVASEEEAYQIFETLNDRGLRLSVPDLLLNFLMRFASNSSQRENIREYWNSIVETMGNRRVSTFLRHMWVSRYGDVKSQGLYREIRQHIKKKGAQSKAFAKECADECAQYTSIIDLDSRALKGSESHVKALVRNLSADKSYPILLSGIRSLSNNDYEKLCRYVVSLVVRHSLIANLNPSDLEDTLYVTARIIRDLKDKKQQSSTILKKAKANLKKINPTRSQLLHGLPDVHLTKKQAQYVLGEVASKIQSDTKAVKIHKTSIEHIFPEYAKKSDWLDYEALHPFTWHIGNLTLLEPKINKDVGDKPFAAKVTAYANSEIEMTKELSTKYTEWNSINVLEQAKSLAKIIDQIWQIQ